MKNRKRHKSTEGYISVYIPEHPRPHYGYVLEHILVMEEYLGIYLPDDCIVHHRDEQRDNNKIENLLLMRNVSNHVMLHNAMRSNKPELVKLTKTGHYNLWQT